MNKKLFYKLLPIIVVLTAVLTLVVNYFITSTWDWKSITKITFINFVIYALFYLLLEVLSQSSSFRWLFGKPLLNGTWIGCIKSELDDQASPYMILITQNLWSINVKTISSRNLKSNSKNSTLYFDGQNYSLQFNWQGKNADRIDSFSGTTILELNKNENEMSGSYFSENNNGYLSMKKYTNDYLDDYDKELFTSALMSSMKNKLPKSYNQK